MYYAVYYKSLIQPRSYSKNDLHITYFTEKIFFNKEFYTLTIISLVSTYPGVF